MSLVRDLIARGELVAAARREADAAGEDGYDVTAFLLRAMGDRIESLEAEQSTNGRDA